MSVPSAKPQPPSERTAYQATFGVLDGEANLFNPQFLDDPALKKVVPPDFLAWYRTDEAQFFRNEILADSPELADPAVARKLYAGVLSRNDRAFTYLAQHGGKILLYHGWEDPAISPLIQIDLYNKAMAANGGVKKTYNDMRLFRIEERDPKGYRDNWKLFD